MKQSLLWERDILKRKLDVLRYIYSFSCGNFGFAAPPVISGLEFEDDNLSPEVALNYYINEDVSVYISYKEGFKSGGVDNSALPTASINPLSPTFEGFGALICDQRKLKALN